MKVKFLFWNIQGKSNDFIAKIKLLTYDVDILLLAEASNIEDDKIETQLGLTKLKLIGSTKNGKFMPKFYSRLTFDEFQHTNTLTSQRGLMAKLNINSAEEILIIGLHFPSKSSCNNIDQLRIAQQYMRDIEVIEKKSNHKRTLIFGDFNMNPFDSGMIAPDGFNATLSSFEAKKTTRKAHYQDYHYFYNPMWGFLGDRNCETGVLRQPGSYYYENKASADSIYWNIFDSVILRPGLIDLFDFNSIQIINKIGTETLVDSNFMLNKTDNPDHLPLTFTINL